ncbi:hypothetical protein ACVWWO_006305 [Bradyrhizobium sp. F1.13.1]
MASPAAIRFGLETRETIDQPDLAARVFRDIGPVHAVDDAGQHETGVAGFQIGPIEQLYVEALADADGLGRICRLLPRDVAVDLRFDRGRNLLELPQPRKHQIGRQRKVRVPLQPQQARDRECIVLVELAQEIGVGDRRAARQLRVLRGQQRHDAAEKYGGGNENSQGAAHASGNTAQGRLFKQKRRFTSW